MKIAAYGDSTQWGSTWDGTKYIQSPNNPPSVLHKMLQPGHPGTVVENKGIPGLNSIERFYGTTLKDGTVVKSWAEEMSTSDASIVFNNTGINDAFLLGFTPADQTYLFGQMWWIARQHGKRFLIETPNPILLGHDVYIAEFVKSLRHLAQVNRIPIIDQYNIIKRWWPNWWDYLPDEVHPDNALYEYKGIVLNHYISLMLNTPVADYSIPPQPSKSPEELEAAGAWSKTG